jgi:urease accessory protein
MRDAAALDLAAPAASPALARVAATLRARFVRRDDSTVLERLYQQGSARMRFPHTRTEKLEAVIINTAGGLTGGDRWDCAIALGDGAKVTLTTPSCERIYRRLAGAATLATELELAPGSALDWLPQETILFDGSALVRDLTVTMAEDASLLAVEPIIFGRAAMGEEVRLLCVSDRWRVRRGGRLIYADRLAIDGTTEAAFGEAAGLAGVRAMATLLLVAPDAADRLEPLRAILPELPARAGASVWDGLLLARIACADGLALRQSLVAMLAILRQDTALPRLWSC